MPTCMLHFMIHGARSLLLVHDRAPVARDNSVAAILILSDHPVCMERRNRMRSLKEPR